MRVEPEGLPVVGVMGHPRDAEGVLLSRLPAIAQEHIPDPMFGLVAKMPAGGRLELHTDAHTLELEVLLTLTQIEGQAPMPAGFDLVVDGEVRTQLALSEGNRIVVQPGRLDPTFVNGPSTTVVFEDLPADATARIEVWLPHRAVVRLRGMRLHGATTYRPAVPRGVRWVHYGSSISHCLEVAQPTQTWPSIVARAAGWDLLNLGLAANCHLDQVVARAIRDTAAEVISIKTGINVVGAATMRERTFVPALHGFLDTVRDGHPETPIVVATPVICPPAEDAAGVLVMRGSEWGLEPFGREVADGALTLQRARELVSHVVDTRRRGGDANLHLLDGLGLFGRDDLAELPDALHPSSAGYRRIAERFLPQITHLARAQRRATTEQKGLCSP